MAKRTVTPKTPTKAGRRTPKKPPAARPRARRLIALAPTRGQAQVRLAGLAATGMAVTAAAPTVEVELALRNVSDDLLRDPEGIFTFRRISDRRQIADQARLELRGTPVRFSIPAGTEVVECEIDLQRYRFARSPLFIRAVGFPRAFDGILLREPGEWRPAFTPWADLPAAFAPLQAVLRQSANIAVLGTRVTLPSLTDAAYDAVTDADAVLAKTALLNTCYRLRTAGPPVVGAANWFSHVDRIIAIGRERVLALVKPEMARLVHWIDANIGDVRKDFERASAALHRDNVPPALRPRVTGMISVKSTHAQGNYQLTITELRDPDEVLLDADIDENGTFWRHAGDLFKHRLTGGTHPVDIHEILVHQDHTTGGFDLGYTLV